MSHYVDSLKINLSRSFRNINQREKSVQFFTQNIIIYINTFYTFFAPKNFYYFEFLKTIQ